jgi:hypothetical protein
MSTELLSPQPGYWEFRRDPGGGTYLWFNCPCGCMYGSRVLLYLEGQAKPRDTAWSWNGDIHRPTLSPSLKRGSPCRWHGHLTNGHWSACQDGAPLAPNVYGAPP